MQAAILTQADHIRAVGYRLRQLIDALDISYADAARDMDVTKNHLGNWMRGDRSYPLEYNMYRFCRIRGVDMNWVFLGDPSALPKRVADRLMAVLLEPEGSEAQASRVSDTD